jgi:hypothetical protein
MLCTIEHHLPNSIAGFIIAWATRSRFSHTAIVINGYRYEALVSKGFVRTKYVPRVGVVETVLDLPVDTGHALFQKLESMRGRKYPNPLYMALSYAIPLLPDILRRPYCSKAVLEALAYVGLYDSVLDIAYTLKPSPGVLVFVAQTLAARQDLRTLGK